MTDDRTDPPAADPRAEDHLDAFADEPPAENPPAEGNVDLPVEGPTAPPAEDPPADAAAVGSARRLRIAVMALGLLAVILAVALAVVVSWWAPLEREASERAEVRDVSRELALRLTTFEGERIEDWVAQTQQLSTGAYASEVDALFDQDFRDALRDARAVSRGELIDLFVQSIDGDEATAFALVRQTIANVNLADPVEDELRMEINLERVDGEWLVAGVAVLPSGGATPREATVPGAEEAVDE